MTAEKIEIDDVNLCLQMMDNHIARLIGFKTREQRKTMPKRSLIDMYTAQIFEVNNIRAMMIRCFPRECFVGDSNENP